METYKGYSWFRSTLALSCKYPAPANEYVFRDMLLVQITHWVHLQEHMEPQRSKSTTKRFSPNHKNNLSTTPYLYIYTHTCIHLYMHTCIYDNTYTYIHRYLYNYTYIYIFIHIQRQSPTYVGTWTPHAKPWLPTNHIRRGSPAQIPSQ